VTTLVVTSSWPRTRDEIAGTFVRSDALTRGKVLAAIPRGPGVARGGPNITVAELPHLELFGSPGAAARLIRAPHRIAGLIPFARAIGKLETCDRVVAHWLIPSGAICRALFGDAELIAHGGDVRLLERAPRPMAAAFLRWLGAVRAVSDDLARRLSAIEPSLRIHVAPMPLSFDRDAARARGRALVNTYGELDVVAARMVASKRIDRAIDHVAHTGRRLALIGDGPHRPRLLDHARNQGVSVIAPGALPHDEALGWIAAARQVLAPLARGEGAPTVIREAHALGVPVVTFT
jgi:teichuronic acid biosynthesis glycosyltransferase TuaC